MIDDQDLEAADRLDRAGSTGHAAGPGARGPGPVRGWTDELREAAADRLPPVVRGRRPEVPLRAVLAALLIAVAVGAAVLARSTAAADSSTTVPSRAGQPRSGWSTGSRAAGGWSAGAPAASPAPAGAIPTGVLPSGAVSPAAGGPVVVDVVGRVRRPGLVHLPAGSRVWDAVLAAGGASGGARLDRINLARLLTDGEQVRVPSATDPVAPIADKAAGGAGGALVGGGGSSSGAGAGSGPIDLNTASAAEFDGLPGVGPVLAGRIVAWRSQHGRFSRVEELGEVQGIGDKLLANLRPLVRV